MQAGYIITNNNLLEIIESQSCHTFQLSIQIETDWKGCWDYSVKMTDELDIFGE